MSVLRLPASRAGVRALHFLEIIMTLANPADRIGRFETPFGVAFAERCQYSNGDIAVQLIMLDGQALGMLSINVSECTDQLGDDEFFAKTYSENEALVGPALASGLFEDTGRTVRSGYLSFPIWRLRQAVRAVFDVTVEVAHGYQAQASSRTRSRPLGRPVRQGPSAWARGVPLVPGSLRDRTAGQHR